MKGDKEEETEEEERMQGEDEEEEQSMEESREEAREEHEEQREDVEWEEMLNPRKGYTEIMNKMKRGNRIKKKTKREKRRKKRQLRVSVHYPNPNGRLSKFGYSYSGDGTVPKSGSDWALRAKRFDPVEPTYAPPLWPYRKRFRTGDPELDLQISDHEYQRIVAQCLVMRNIDRDEC